MILRIVIYVLASWLLAAHFLRAGNFIMVALCLVTPGLFLVRRAWSLVALEVLSYAAAVVWLVTAWQIIAMRRLLGEPWWLSAVILVSVAGFTVLAGLLLRSRALRARYRAGE